MREALHVIDNDLYRLPDSASKEEVNNLKKLAEKNLFQCPYCRAKLIVKYGDTKGMYFSHQHSEACEESRKVDQAEKKYRRQIERETKLHHTIQAILYDEITMQAKRNPTIKVDYGYRAKHWLKEYPDIWVKIADQEYALSVITNVNSLVDYKLSSSIQKRQQYFLDHGMEPIWFIEKKEQAIEIEKNSLILWDAELTIASKTKQDREWDSLLTPLIADEMFFEYFNYPVSTKNTSVDVKSLYYIYSNNDRIVVKVQRFLKDRLVKPYRSFLLGQGYEIPFSEAVQIKNEFILSNKELEIQYQKKFTQKYEQLRFAFHEQQRREKELEQQEEDKRQKLIQEKFQKDQERRKRILEAASKQQKLREKEGITTVTSYNDLKFLLKERIGLTQPQQMELWTIYMPKIGLKNSRIVWDIFISNECNTFNELRTALQNFISRQKK